MNPVSIGITLGFLVALGYLAGAHWGMPQNYTAGFAAGYQQACTDWQKSRDVQYKCEVPK